LIWLCVISCEQKIQANRWWGLLRHSAPLSHCRHAPRKTTAHPTQRSGTPKIHGATEIHRAAGYRAKCEEFSPVHTALEQHGMTCTNRDECNKFSHHSHVEISHESSGPFWLKKSRCPLRTKQPNTSLWTQRSFTEQQALSK